MTYLENFSSYNDNYLRTLDANLNRTAEGLRVLEDVARFLLNDSHLTQQLKYIRHELLSNSHPIQESILARRQTEKDVGTTIEVDNETSREDLRSLIIANSRRAQESLRVLEEFSKLPSISSTLNSTKLQQFRYKTYELEQKLFFKLARKEKASNITGLYVIIDTQFLRDHTPSDIVKDSIRGGATIIQLRDKQNTAVDSLALAKELKDICADKALFIINDRLDLALAADADGLHLGQQDIPITEARKLLPPDKILGCSTSTLEEAIRAQEHGADYIAIGAMFPTQSKERFRLAGPQRVRQVRQAISSPIVAIGGIKETNINQITEAGADAIAVITAISDASDMAEAARILVNKITEKTKTQS